MIMNDKMEMLRQAVLILFLIATRKLVEGGYRKKPFEMT